MARQDTDKLLEFIRSYFEYEGDDLTEQTCLVEKFNSIDPEDFYFFLIEVSKEFEINKPKLQLAKTRKRQPNIVLRLSRMWQDLKNDDEETETVRVESLTIEKLREIISNHEWPLEWVQRHTE